MWNTFVRKFTGYLGFFFRYNSIAVNIGQNATKQAVCRNLFQIIRKIAYSVSNELFPHQTQHINMTK